jgi:hypothetical protein
VRAFVRAFVDCFESGVKLDTFVESSTIIQEQNNSSRMSCKISNVVSANI